jgi:hypothetical protein
MGSKALGCEFHDARRTIAQGRIRDASSGDGRSAYDADGTTQMEEPQGSRGHIQGVHL